VIQGLYDRVVTHAGNGARLVELSAVADGFKELASDTDARDWPIWGLSDDADWAHLETKLGAHIMWKGQKFVPLVFYEAWRQNHPAKNPSFVAAVGTMTVRAAKDYLYMGGCSARGLRSCPPPRANRPTPASSGSRCATRSTTRRRCRRTRRASCRAW
jgi:hypothetical protein